MAKERATRIAKGIKDALSELLVRGLKDPRVTSQGLITVTDVQMSDDLGSAIVYVSVVGGDLTETIDGLMQARSYLQREVAKRLSLRRVPRLKIASSEQIGRVQRLDQIWAELEAERRDEERRNKGKE